MAEVELRAKATPEAINLLKKIGKKLHETFEHDKYFKFKEDIQRKLIIRLRKNNRGHFLTFKGSSVLPQDTAWQEWEQPIEHSDALENLFLSNGLVLVTEIKKQRTTFEYEGVTINLDAIENLGRFIEFELISDDPIIAQKRLREMMKNILKISEENIVTKGYVKLMLKE